MRHRCPHNQRIQHPRARALLINHQRIDIHFRNIIFEIRGKPRQPHNRIDHRIAITHRHAAHTREQFHTAQLIEHFTGLRGRDGCDAVRNIFQHFDKNAAESDNDDGAEDRITDHAQHHLHAGPRHFLHQHAINFGLRRVLLR